MTAKYSFREAYYIPYAVNERISAHLARVPREPLMLIYGRPPSRATLSS